MSNQTLRAIAESYAFTDIVDRLSTLDTEQRSLVVGILGEFSAGKSTLVNAMLGRKLLPALEKPTTGRITEVHPTAGQEQLAFYLRKETGELVELSVLDFDDALEQGGKEVAVVLTPPNELLHEGYRLVDTPGLASLEEVHTDITFGYLPFLDGAIVCQDINRGGLTASLKAFLEKPEVRPFIGRIAFALTRADSKPQAKAEEIRQSFVREVSEFFTTLGVATGDLNARVLAISPLAMLNERTGAELLTTVVRDFFVSNRQTLLATRLATEQAHLANAAISRLHLMRDNLALDRSQYAARRAEISDNIQQLESERQRVMRVIGNMRTALRAIVSEHVSTLKTALLSADAQSTGGIVASVQPALQADVSALISMQLGDAEGIRTKIDAAKLQAALGKLENLVDIGKTIGTAAMVAYLVPTNPHLATPLLTSVVEEDNPEMNLTAEVMEGVAGAGLVRMAHGSRLGHILEQVNPVEWAGDWLHGYFKEKTLDSGIDALVNEITRSILAQLQRYATEQVFAPLESAYQAGQQQLDELGKQEKQDASTIKAQRDKIADDILSLQTC